LLDVRVSRVRDGCESGEKGEEEEGRYGTDDFTFVYEDRLGVLGVRRSWMVDVLHVVRRAKHGIGRIEVGESERDAGRSSGWEESRLRKVF
jgi:hypothetical protein